jgi:anti-sigma-K factor RskA
MTNETKSHEVHPDDLALYALGALEGNELAQTGKHVETCASCRAEVQQINADLGVYALATAPESAPPARAKERLMAEIGRDLPETTALRKVWHWSFVFRTAVALLLLAALLVEGNRERELRDENAQLRQQLIAEQSESAQARAIAETIKAPDAMKLTLVAMNTKPQPSAHAFYSREKARVFLIANNLAPLEKGKMYELWLLPKAGEPVPAGMFQSGEDWNAQMLHSGLPAGMEAKGFAITIEPEQGSLKPSQQPILMGTTS